MRIAGPPTSIRKAGRDELETLEELFAEVFGAGDRPHGWFDRKLRREVACRALSMIAVDEHGERIGFIISSAPASLAGVARLVSLGVVAGARRRGIGRALIEAAAQAASAAGLERLTALVEADRQSFYEDAEFRPEEVLRTLLAPTETSRAELVLSLQRLSPAPWDRPGTLAVGGWLAEAWERTPSELRHTYAIGGPAPLAWAHVSREGRARLIHRLLIASPEAAPVAPEALSCEIRGLLYTLCEALTPSGPLLLYGLPAVSPVTDLLLGAGWTCVQESTCMVRRLTSPRATDGPPP